MDVKFWDTSSDYELPRHVSRFKIWAVIGNKEFEYTYRGLVYNEELTSGKLWKYRAKRLRQEGAGEVKG